MYLIVCDYIGIILLYMGYDEYGNFYVVFEMKVFVFMCKIISEFFLGYYLWSKEGKVIKYYKCDWMEYDVVKDNIINLEDLCVVFEKVVKLYMMFDVFYVVLLFGGLDFLLVLVVVVKYVVKCVEDEDKIDVWWFCLYSFVVGLEGVLDFKVVKKVVDMIGIVYYEINFII